MTFTVPGHTNLEGHVPYQLFPPRNEGSGMSATKTTMRYLKTYLTGGGKVFIEFLSGARKGTIGELVIDPTDMDAMYVESTHWKGATVLTLANQFKEFQIKFDDRPNIIKIMATDKTWYRGLALRFDAPGTVWVYETKTIEKKPPKVLFDHFGVQLEPGQLVLVPMGTKGDIHTRFAYIKSISATGTIKVQAIKTRTNHRKEENNVSPTIHAHDLVVLDANDIKDKVTMAKLANA